MRGITYKYNELRKNIKTYVDQLKAMRTYSRFSYPTKGTIDIAYVAAAVATAANLGYDTKVTVIEGKVHFTFSDRVPKIPFGLQYL